MTSPIVIRPIRETDLPQLTRLVGSIADGLTTLPNDPDFLKHKIDDSLRGFDPRVRKPAGESYLFVLEDLSSGTIAGTSGILSRVGGFEPFYTYKRQRHQQSYAPLDIVMEHDSLHLCMNHKGPTEICSLFLHPDYRRGGLGRLLSLARFCFIKAFPHRFANEVIAELRGFIDAEGRSPFWDAVGVNFFQRDYYTADILSGLGNKDFIEALMPRHPIYINLLPYSAQRVIGKVHPDTEPALRLLLNEGFQLTDEIDIFDAGPLLFAKLDALRIWKQIQPATAAVNPDPTGTNTRRCLITNAKLDFRALISKAVIEDSGRLLLPADDMAALELDAANHIHYVLFD